ncbi:hypothetical protein [Pseudonocardia sp. HH130630-07]|uniref:hypothetical protein n=1 Tax=Pseudonocardia sp. HH130630-07 TaxID=1690815 RepID=UPI000814C796|nr:hypothetical protein [Pseudonocardia sp. HH130630-07]ANY07831.1 hypothetical protein AFB00_17725 [Pseudonocardia sp. HH130630-07]
MATVHDHHLRHTTPAHLGRVLRSTHRWPALLGAALAVAVAGPGPDALPALAVAAFVYLGAAALGRPGASWPLLVAGMGILVGARFVPGLDPVVALLVAGGAVGVAGAVARPVAGRSAGVARQAAMLLVVVAIAGAATVVAPVWAGVLVATGLLAHAGWDVWHHVTMRTVSRSLSEFCAVLDAVLAVLVLVATFA